MATTQQSTHRQHLVERFGEKTVGHLEGFIDERINVVVWDSNELMKRVRGLHEDVTASGDREAADAVNEATASAKEAAAAAKAAKDSGNPKKVAEAEDKVAKAEDKVAKAEDKLDKGDSREREMVEIHERVLAEKTNRPRPPSRFNAIENRLTVVENRAWGSSGPSIWAYAAALFVVAGLILLVIAVFNDGLTIIEALSIAGLAALVMILVDKLAHVFDRKDDDGSYEHDDVDQRTRTHASH